MRSNATSLGYATSVANVHGLPYRSAREAGGNGYGRARENRQGLWDLCLIGSNGWKLEVVTVRRLWFPV